MTSVKWLAMLPTYVKYLTLASVAAINEQKQVKSIDWKIGKLMILIDFVHEFNFFFWFFYLPSILRPIIYFVSKIKWARHFKSRWKKMSKSTRKVFFFFLSSVPLQEFALLIILCKFNTNRATQIFAHSCSFFSFIFYSHFIYKF